VAGFARPAPASAKNTASRVMKATTHQMLGCLPVLAEDSIVIPYLFNGSILSVRDIAHGSDIILFQILFLF
jgi:hypothetical protein